MRVFNKCVFFIMMMLLLIPLLSPVFVRAAVSQQQIIAGNSMGKSGETVEVPIHLKSEGNVSAMQLQISYDKDVLELLEIKKGSDLQSSFSVLSNLENGKLVIGSLGSIIESGTQEVAIAVFKLHPNAASETYEIQLAEASFSDVDANNVSSQFQRVNGFVTVDNSGFVHVSGITVNPSTLHLTAGGATGAITTTISPANASNKNVTWSSSDEGVATVVDGIVTPVIAGTATITATTDDGSFTATIVVTVQADQSGTGGDDGDDNHSTPTPTQPETPTSDVDIIVNGKVESAGTAKTTEVNDWSVTTITVDPQKMDERIAAEVDGAMITIPVNTHSDVIIGELNGQMIQNMEQKQVVVEIRTENATYTLPAKQININAISEQIGKDVQLKDIKIQIEIATPDADMIKVVESSATDGEFTLVVPPINFSVKGIYDNTTIDVSEFTNYVERLIAIPEDVDPNQITTGIVVDPEGMVRHVPTKIVLIDGKYYASVNSLTNSTYTVIYHPIEFKDVADHWAKDAVNDMGSRMVISGIGNDLFNPDQDITRAEFAAIIVRGLGLKLESGADSFPYVKETDWYSGAVQTAYTNNLISGFEDGTFRPNDRITREQAMLIVSKAMAITDLQGINSEQGADGILRTFSDAESVSSWAANGIADSVEAGIISGRSKDLLAPKAFITRAEVAVMLQRLLQKSELI